MYAKPKQKMTLWRNIMDTEINDKNKQISELMVERTKLQAISSRAFADANHLTTRINNLRYEAVVQKFLELQDSCLIEGDNARSNPIVYEDSEELFIIYERQEENDVRNLSVQGVTITLRDYLHDQRSSTMEAAQWKGLMDLEDNYRLWASTAANKVKAFCLLETIKLLLINNETLAD